MLGVQVAVVNSAGSNTIAGFFYINGSAPANRKNEGPFRAHGGQIGTLAYRYAAIRTRSLEYVLL